METEQLRSEIVSLLSEFKKSGICHDAKQKERFAKMLRFQDLIGRTTQDSIWEIYEPMDQNEREMLLWACFSTVSQQTAVQVLKWTTGRFYKRKVKEELLKWEEERLDEIRQKERQLENYEAWLRDRLKLEIEVEILNRKWYWQEIAKLRRMLKDSKDMIEKLMKSNETLIKTVEDQDKVLERSQDALTDLLSLKQALVSIMAP